MSLRQSAPASLPPAGITGLDPAWSRLVTATDAEGSSRTWHLLDSWAERRSFESQPAVTLLCVHGNPSWSFLWRHVLARMPAEVRVIAIDQLDMGFSERTAIKRTLAMRIRDLCHLTEALSVTGPVVTLAHDWGGPVSLGWALEHLQESKQELHSHSPGKVCTAGIILTNTAVHQPSSASAPAIIRLIRLPVLLKLITVTTRAFISGAVRMSRPALSKAVSDGFHAPYLNASRRRAIADFVADIPLDENHESASTLSSIASGLDKLANLPALLLWGPRDRVFGDIYLDDLQARLPHADIHRYPEAAHFLTEEVDVAAAVQMWLSTRFASSLRSENGTGQGNTGRVSNIAASRDALIESSSESRSRADEGGANRQNTDKRRALADFSPADPNSLAVAEGHADARCISFGELSEKVELLAAGMAAFGIAPGNRVAVMIMPGINLSLVVYACWRLGAILVLVDSGLGRRGMQRALLGARPDYLVGIDKAMVAARLLGWPGQRISVAPCSMLRARALSVVADLPTLLGLGAGKSAPVWPAPDAVAAVAFTSGSTGPSKGVVYTHRQIETQRDALMSLYGICATDRLVAAFAPFALYGPTMGIPSMVPDMDVTRPGSLTANTLIAAVQRIDATLVFASPAALASVANSASSLPPDTMPARTAVRLALSAGAPVRSALLEACSAVFPNASWHTPYGMTEVLPIADISLEELRQTGAGTDRQSGSVTNRSAGVCVGFPLPCASVSIDPLNRMGEPTGCSVDTPGVLGEIIVRAGHMRQGYDRLWHTEQLASLPEGSHRTGDIGQLDADGRLWVGGRLGHVIVTADGPLAPVACEQILETIDGVAMAAVVGVGPLGAQTVVAVLQVSTQQYRSGLAPLELLDLARRTVGDIADLAAVLIVKRLPVDRRHESKVDRSAVALWAERVLSGETVADP